MKRLVSLTLILILCIEISIWATEKSEPKVPHAGGDLTPVEAYEMLMADPENTFLIDCRTMSEYEFVGHPAMAYNIPYKFWTPEEGMIVNPNFAEDVMEKFNKTDRLLIICRSGKRSCFACDILIEVGFENIFNVLGGFEGDKVKDQNSIYYGYRRNIRGWQHDGLPYTYELNDELIYKLHSPCGCE
ncbi:MAG: hypothetical protein H8D22_03950 [Candidatus Cloacimonetes bacterium]|nr:hypothetical protein [Candidatus Cloacimonadota bacterium]